MDEISKGVTESGIRAPSTNGVVNDVENANKLLREKLGPSFALNKGDVSFSMQSSDGQELCNFVNKLHPDAIALASSTVSRLTVKLTCNMTSWQASLQVCEGTPYTCFDDLTAGS
ncbi:unnamed protein product [Caenorhabditis nigoni]